MEHAIDTVKTSCEVFLEVTVLSFMDITKELVHEEEHSIEKQAAKKVARAILALTKPALVNLKDVHGSPINVSVKKELL